MYQFDSRVRYSEVDKDRKMTPVSVINYFQDCSSFQSENLGIGIDFHKKRNRAWFLASWQIVIGRMPVFGEKITVQTWPYAFKGFMGERNYCICDEHGERLAWANSVWTYVNVETGHPARVDDLEKLRFELSEKLDMEYMSRKIAVPKECVRQDSFVVARQHLDSNNHVNNGQYVQMAAAFLPETFEIGQIRTEYRKAAVLGNVMVPLVHQEEKLCTVLLCDEEEKPYAIIEFTAKE